MSKIIASGFRRHARFGAVTGIIRPIGKTQLSRLWTRGIAYALWHRALVFSKPHTITAGGFPACVIFFMACWRRHGWRPQLSAQAAVWTAADNAQLRSDIEILAGAGVVDGIVTQWPLPWAGLLNRLETKGALTNQPAYVVAAAQRVLEQGKAETGNGFHAQVSVDATNDPSFVRGFDATGRQKIQTQFAADMRLSSSTLLHLSIGLQGGNPYKPPPPPNGVPTFDHESGYVSSGYFLDDRADHQTLIFDGSYLAQNIGNSVIYAGYLPHWWGPGWMSSLMMSTNARPFPQIGISRLSTEAFSWPILRWLGPWQAEFLVGVLDGPGATQNILTDSLRFAFNPISGLELGFSRTQLLCGTGHPCKPVVAFFTVNHDVSHPDNSNSAGQFDFRYGNSIAGVPFSVYMQNMFMDAGFPKLEDDSNVFGASVWIPTRAQNSPRDGGVYQQCSDRQSFHFRKL